MEKNSLLDKLVTDADIIPTPFYCLGLDQHYLSINQAGLKTLGLEASQSALVTQSPYDVYPEKAADNIVQHHKQVIHTGQAAQLQEIINSNGRDASYYSTTIAPLYDNSGELIGTSAVLAEITDKELISQLLANQLNSSMASRLEEIANTVPVPFYWLDLNQRYLGINSFGLKATGTLSYENDFQGKSPYDIYPQETAHKMVLCHQQVIQANKIICKEEFVEDIDGDKKHFNTTVAPLHDDEGNIIGTYGIVLDIGVKQDLRSASEIAQAELERQRELKRIEKANIFKRLEDIANTIPVPFYWLDLDQRYLGVNNFALKINGNVVYANNFIGKSPHQVYPQEMADNIVRHHKKVIETNEIGFEEEIIEDVRTGNNRYFNATIAPLHDDDDNIIGTYAISVEVTAEKQEEIRKLAQQKQFSRIISQAVHDIRSPLTSMMMIVKACADMPTPTRLALKEAANSIDDIAENLLQNWRLADDRDSNEENRIEPVLLSLLFMQVVAGKRFQFQDSGIKFKLDVSQSGYFSCVKSNTSQFKRMLSNLINNAVAAYEGQEGEITCLLNATNDRITINIIDQGKGIEADTLAKINQGIKVTSGKQDGYGIGLTQVRDTLALCRGELIVQSNPGEGTRVRLDCPRTHLAPWLADSINLNIDDTLVVVDDDESMHRAWKAHFGQLEAAKETDGSEGSGQFKVDWLRKNSIHFRQGQEAIDYINNRQDKSKILLLTDYELLNQSVDGVDVIKQTDVQRVVVVTSHYDDKQLRDYIIGKNVKVLPKQLAWQVPIKLRMQTLADTRLPASQTNIVIVDDDRNFTNGFLLCFQKSDKPIDAYNRPEDFLDKLPSYSKETRIYLDNNLASGAKGLDVAEHLYRAGYKNLFLLSGQEFNNSTVPDYITLMNKRDLVTMEEL
jgi:PAS domain S-box-containing protein